MPISGFEKGDSALFQQMKKISLVLEIDVTQNSRSQETIVSIWRNTKKVGEASFFPGYKDPGGREEYPAEMLYENRLASNIKLVKSAIDDAIAKEIKNEVGAVLVDVRYINPSDTGTTIVEETLKILREDTTKKYRFYYSGIEME